MDVQKVDTQHYPAAERARRWREAMASIYLPVVDCGDAAGLAGRIVSRQSALGTRISLIEATAQTLSGGCSQQPDGTWLTMILEGQGALDAGRESRPLQARDILFGRTATASAQMSYHENFKQISLVMPPMIIDPRLIGPIAPRVGYLSSAPSINKVFCNLLASFAGAMEHMQQEELRPVELSLAQFLISCIITSDKTVTLGGAAGNRAAHLNQIRLTIEAMLSNPDLDTKMIADQEGVSIRYLQKLFSASGQTFAKYVHQRRLERCREDLVSPNWQALTITEICFRWGFNSSAHFSRAFRNHYGVSPRDFRASHFAEVEH